MGKKRITCALLAALMLLLPAGCGGSGGKSRDKEDENVSYEQGLELCALIGETASSEDYLDLTNAPTAPEIRQAVREIAAGRYSDPRHLYEIDFPSLEDALMGAATTKEDREEARDMLRGVSDELLEELEQRLSVMLANRLNAAMSDSFLAAASLCSASAVYVDEELDEPTVWLYVFRRGPSVLVTFLPGRDGAVSATAIPVLGDILNISSEDAIEDSIYDAMYMEVRVRELDLPE